MILLTNPIEIRKVFERLIKAYNSYYWAIAWAGKDFEHSILLRENSQRIKKIVVGLHFNQTHPEFIKAFLSNKGVRYAKSEEGQGGVFHPKVYLFDNGPLQWEALIGSANFTSGAFNKNSEAFLLINQKDTNSRSTYNNLKKYVDELYSSGIEFTDEDWIRYDEVYRKNEIIRNQLSVDFEPKSAMGTKPFQAGKGELLNQKLQKYFVVYHSEEGEGRLWSEVDGLSFHTKKPLVNKSLGHSCFVIVGKGRSPKEYHLASIIKKITDIKDMNEQFEVSGEGVKFQNSILLNEINGWSDFLKSVSNFSVGFTDITDINKYPFCKTLISLAETRYGNN